MNRSVLFLCAALFAAGCAESSIATRRGWKQVTVEAEGWSPLTGQDALSARRRALVEAQRKAVEKVVGVVLKGRTRVDNAIDLRQSVEANVGGTIRAYDVLSERSDDGFMKVRIRAIVLSKPFDAPSSARAPRFYVEVASPEVVSALRAELMSWNFRLVDRAEDADVVVTGLVETHGTADTRLGGLYSYKAVASLDIADRRSGVLSHARFEGEHIDTEDDASRALALQKAGQLAGMDLASRYSEKVKPEADETAAAGQ